jgi:hypothetical protein
MEDTKKVVKKMKEMGMTKQASAIEEIMSEYEIAKEAGASTEDMEFFKVILGFFGKEALKELEESEEESKPTANK